jgi:hypothetical protein
MKNCYICNQPATSREHVPAKCFFPKNKRVNLMTVESCDLHNIATSKDDEYVRNIIAMSLGNNGIALSHFLSECLKSFQRSPKLLSATTKIKKTVFVREFGKPNIGQAAAFKIDRERFDLVLKKIAYALFYKNYNQTWERELLVGTEFLRTQNMQTDDIGALIQTAKQLAIPIVYKGVNQDVFKYSFQRSTSRDENDQMLFMTFYGGFEVWIFPKMDSAGPKLK